MALIIWPWQWPIPHDIPGFFFSFGGGGLAFGDDVRFPSGTESDVGWHLCRGMESDEGDLEKLSADAKNASYSKFWCFNPRLTKLYFVTRLTKGGCYNPLLDFLNRTPYEIDFGINR